MRVYLVILINVLLLIMVGCQPDKTSPEAITKNFVERMSTGDKEGAALLGTEPTLRYLNFREQSIDMLGENAVQPITVQEVDCSIVNNTAECLFCCDQNGKKEIIPLLKVGDEWKVDINVDEMIQELEEAMKKLEEEQVE